MLKDHSLRRTAAIAMLTLFTIGVALFIPVTDGHHTRTAQASTPVSVVYVTKRNGDIEKVRVSDGFRSAVANTNVNTADSLVFEPLGKLIVTGGLTPDIYRIDTNLPGGFTNYPVSPVPLNATALIGPNAQDAAIDPTGSNVLVTNDSNGIDVVNLTSHVVTHRPLGPPGLEISGIAFDNATSPQLWVTDYSNHTVGIATPTSSPTTYTPLCTGVAVGGGADGLSFDPSTGKLYVSGNVANTITELKIGPNSCSVNHVFPLTTCSQPDGVAADGLGGVFVACATGDNVILLNTLTSSESSIATGIPTLDDIAPVTGLGAPTGSITICKKTNPDPAAGNPVFYIDNPPEQRTAILHDNGCFTDSTLSPGTYNFSEQSMPPDWQLTNIVCTGGSSIGFFVDPNGFSLSSFIQGDTGVSINLAPGENVTCTFTNTLSCLNTLDANADGFPDGEDISTGTAGIPNVDPIWTVSSAPAGVPTPNAYAVTPDTPGWVTASPANWIDPNNTGTDVSDPSGTYVYDTSFTVPKFVSHLRLNFGFAADNNVTNFVLSGPVGFVPVGILPALTGSLATNFSTLHPATPTTIPLTPSTSPQIYKLTATVTNTSEPSTHGDPTGFLLKGSINCVLGREVPVGGVAALTVSGSGSPFPWAPLAAVAAGVVAVMGAGLWYGRRRWLR